MSLSGSQTDEKLSRLTSAPTMQSFRTYAIFDAMRKTPARTTKNSRLWDSRCFSLRGDGLPTARQHATGLLAG